MGRKGTPKHRSKLHCLSMVNLNKSEIKRKRSRNKTNKSIKKLFHQLRHDSASNSTLENTVIEVDTSLQCTEVNTSLPKIKNTYKQDGNLIVIGDDDDLVENHEPCPLQCSTPILKSNTILSPAKNTDLSNNFTEDVINLTTEFNKDSYLTIDLTNESLNTTHQSENTVIDLANTSRISNSIDSLSMSGDSDVTVINTKRKSKFNSRQMQKFASGIAKMNSSERGKLLEFIAQKIFNGCNGPNSTNNSLHSLKLGLSKSTETAEDTYIREVILGQATSRNSIGSNIYNPERDIKNKSGLRMVVIDGSNVAMHQCLLNTQHPFITCRHSKGRVFSVKALKICIDYFVRRGHIVKAFVPRFRCKYGKSTDGKLLDQLERQGLVVYTPSREIQGRMITSYDDRYIVQCAAEFDGVIVSGDNYRDLLLENPRWRNVIENRLLQFTWVDDMVMFPKDPLGRNGPTLEQFLKHPA